MFSNNNNGEHKNKFVHNLEKHLIKNLVKFLKLKIKKQVWTSVFFINKCVLFIL